MASQSVLIPVAGGMTIQDQSAAPESGAEYGYIPKVSPRSKSNFRQYNTTKKPRRVLNQSTSLVNSENYYENPELIRTKNA